MACLSDGGVGVAAGAEQMAVRQRPRRRVDSAAVRATSLARRRARMRRRRSSVVGEAADPVNSFDVARIEGAGAEEGGGGGDGWCREPERVAIYTGGRLVDPPPPAPLCLPRS